MACPPTSPHVPRVAFTVVELLVVIVIISLLLAFLMPAIHSSRESSRQATCQNNLRQFGVGLHQNAQRKRGLLCSGAFDWLADGCVSEIGWVADLVDQGATVGSMLCPSNPAKMAATYNDLLTAETSTLDNKCVNTAGKRKDNPCAKIIAGIGSRSAVVAGEIYDPGYNTNYTASWFLVRSRVALDDQGNYCASPAGCPMGIASRNSTGGPLNQVFLDASGIPTSILPLLGCGAAAPDTLKQTVRSIPSGAKLTVAFTRGPVQVSTDPNKDMKPLGDSNAPRSEWGTKWEATLQDYRGFGPVHRGLCNVLFADGHVDTLLDQNNDRLINNGFPSTAENGFKSDAHDVEPTALYSRWCIGVR